MNQLKDIFSFLPGISYFRTEMQKLLEKEQQLSQKEATIANKEEQLVQLEQLLLQREKDIVNKDTNVTDREQHILQREKTVFGSEERNRRKENILEERDRNLTEHETTLTQRGKQLSASEENLQKRDTVVNDREKAIIEKEQTLKKSEEEIESEKSKLQQKKESLFRTEKSLKERDIRYNKEMDRVKNIDSILKLVYERPSLESNEVNKRDEQEPAAIFSPPVNPSEDMHPNLDIIKNIKGSVQDVEVEYLHKLAKKTKNTILELGSFRGKSTVALLMGSQNTSAVVHAVDPFISSDCGTGGATIVDSAKDYKMFMKNTIKWKDHLVFHKMKSTEVDWKYGPIDLFFIDSFHTYDEVHADFNHFAPNLSPNAYVVFHDYSPYKPLFPGVVKFVDELLDSGDWLWDEFRGVMIGLKRAPSRMKKQDVIENNKYIRNTHRTLVEYVEKYETIQQDFYRFQDIIDKAKQTNNNAILLKGPFKHFKGHLYVAHVPHLQKYSDNELYVESSPLVLVENSTTLGPPHTQHNIIGESGEGRYSHWGEDIYFSSSDNTDPNKNGRIYWAFLKVT